MALLAKNSISKWCRRDDKQAKGVHIGTRAAVAELFSELVFLGDLQVYHNP
jgi:hypothetical protein